jgi:hypothetical protein
LSDELAPVDLARVVVHPYARALCLKSPPPPPCSVPHGTVVAGRRLHVPVASLGVRIHTEPLPLAAVFFVCRGSGFETQCQSLTRAGAVAHLVANGLNLAAHNEQGLDAARELSRLVPCFKLDSTRLADAVDVVREILCGESSRDAGRRAARCGSSVPVVSAVRTRA